MMGLADFGISVNGGGPQTGGIDVAGGSTIDFVPTSIVGWKRARWEIPDYPEGWATPSGWTLDGSTGVIYSTAIPQPAQITLPDAGTLWGVWMPRLRVNEQIDTDQSTIDGLLNDDNAFCVLSPAGLRDIGAREEEHFTTSVTRIKKWLRSYQRNLRTIESQLGGAPAGSTAPEASDAVGDGVANDTSALAARLATIPATNGALIMGARTYLVAGTDPAGCLAPPMGGSYIGQGPVTVLKTTSNTAILRTKDADAADRAKFTLFKNFKLLGNATGAGQNGLEVGYTGADGTSQLLVESVVAEDMGGTTGRGFSFAFGDETIGPHFVTCEAKNCGDGFYAAHAGSMTGCKASECDRGLVIASGNVNWTGGQIIQNVIGVEVIGGGNDAHSIVSAAHINHNTTAAVKVGAISNAMTFADCHIYDGAIQVNGDGVNQGIVHFDGGEFDVTTITATDGGIRFTNAVFDTAYGVAGVVTTTGGSGLGWVEFVNCRGRTGPVPSWIRDRVLAPYTFASDADQNLTWQQSVAETIRVLAGVTTATRTLTNKWGPGDGRTQRIVNRNAQSVAFKWASGLEVTIPTNTWAVVAGNGSDAIVLESGTLIADAAYDPAAQVLSSWVRGSFAGAPWTGVASAGSSGSRNYIVGVDPSVGTSLNGFASADFNGVDDFLTISGGLNMGDLISTTAYRVSFIVEFDTVPAPAGNIFDNPAIFSESGGNFGIVFNTSGIHCYHHDGAYKVASSAASVTTGTKYAVDVVYNGTNITVSVNAVAGTPVTAGTLGAITGSPRMGRNFSTVYSDLRIWDFYTAQSALSGVTASQHKSYINSRYALSL